MKELASRQLRWSYRGNAGKISKGMVKWNQVLKLIRSMLSSEVKKKVQPLLQRAYSENKDGFYVYAPKQKGNVKAQLGYIGRYIRRPAIAVNRIEAYDGQMVTFRYYDKTDGLDKRETVTVEEFIMRLIRHIPNEQFKTIRHYGVYAREEYGREYWEKHQVNRRL